MAKNSVNCAAIPPQRRIGMNVGTMGLEVMSRSHWINQFVIIFNTPLIGDYLILKAIDLDVLSDLLNKFELIFYIVQYT